MVTLINNLTLLPSLPGVFDLGRHLLTVVSVNAFIVSLWNSSGKSKIVTEYSGG